MYKIRK